LKTFIWTRGKAQASKESNDDLVMSLAIGAWLFDTYGSSSNSSKVLANALLAGMSKQNVTYKTPEKPGMIKQFESQEKHKRDYGKPIVTGQNHPEESMYQRRVGKFDWLFK
jgi:hypothetical protein